MNSHDRIIEILNQHTPDTDFYISEVAEKVRAHLEEKEPDLLEEWLREQLSSFLATSLRRVQSSRRMRDRKRMKARAFSQSIKNWSGAPEDNLTFNVTYTVDDEHTRRRVGDMTGDDHNYVAESYERTAENHKMLAAFHRAVARKVGKRKTGDVLTPQDYHKLYSQIARL